MADFWAIECGVPCQFPSQFTRTTDNHPLIEAILIQHEQCAVAWIESGAVEYRMSHNGRTPLILCAIHDLVYTMAKLLDKGCNVNEVDVEGRNALFYAVIQGNPECVDLLIDANADLLCGDSTYSNYDVVQQAVWFGWDKIVEIASKTGVDINKCSMYTRKSPLMVASEVGHVACVKKLVKLGASVNVQNKEGKTALYYAKTAECADELLKMGADVNVHGGKSVAPLMRASQNGKLDILKVLVDHGADVNFQTDRRYTTALIATVANFHTKCAEFLVHCGADLNIVDGNMGSALDVAFQHCDTKCISLFLSKGSHVNLSPNSDSKYLTVCSIEHNEEAWRMMFVAGEKVPKWAYKKLPDLKNVAKHTPRLMHLCRDAIRKHMLAADANENLFHRTPKLGLPEIITDYMLYNVSLTN